MNGLANSIIEDEVKEFPKHFNKLAAVAFSISTAHGWDEKGRSDGEAIALMHSELSEALESLRLGDPPSEHLTEHSSTEEELADVIIRIMSYAHSRGFKVGEAVLAKMMFNNNRPYKHGGKRF